MSIRPLCVIQSPLATRSGYGDMARDIVRHILELDRYEVVLASLPWGGCPMNALDPEKDKDIIAHIARLPINLPRKPELFIQISVPNEFTPVGQYNIGITAGIETTVCSPEWIEGCNRMDVVWTISQHSKAVFELTRIDRKDRNGTVTEMKIQKPLDILHNCIHEDIFKYTKKSDLAPSIIDVLDPIPESFCFLYVGHWLAGDIGADRKNVGLLVKTFCETFKMTPAANRPALILKTSGATFSLLDREEILKKIRHIRKMVGIHAPNVYLLHGDLSEVEMNSLYNHPKVKVHVSFTKGEGFCRPLLEATQSKKPVIASGWSGQLDFLNPEQAILLSGELQPVESSAVWNGVILKEAMWFNVNTDVARKTLLHVFKHYDTFLPRAQALGDKNRQAFGYAKIRDDLKALLDKYVPTFAMAQPLNLPKLKKIGAANADG